MAISEIEKLERRYAENPQGLTFAPLAEVHRKNGDVARALDLLRPGLELHPDYIPASIVLGRCHLDLGELPAAEAAFTHVLDLDGENVIALKALADINERLFRFDDAERWLHTLLSVDRSNDEARDQLERVATSRRQAEQASSVDPDASLATEPATESAPAAATSPSEPSEASGTPAADEAMPLDLEELVSPPEPSEPLPEGLELEQPVTLDEAVTPLEGLVGRDHPAEDDDADQVTSPEPDGFRVELSEEIVLQSAGGGEFQVPDAAEELRGRSVASPAEAPPVLAAESAEPLPAPAEAAAEPGMFVTESMAAPSPPAPPRQAYMAKETHGQSVAEFFRGMLAARPPTLSVSPAKAVDATTTPVPVAEAEGAPTRPAHDSLSLSSIFGDEGTPTPPAVPVSAAAEPSTPADGGVSFDEFYSPPDRDDAPRAARVSDTKSDDLDQFHAWLQNLKR
jgi:Tetratricopeptide repeat